MCARSSDALSSGTLARLLDESTDLFEFSTKRYSSAHVNGSDMNGCVAPHFTTKLSNPLHSLVDVPVYIPGASQPIFLLIARNSTSQDESQAARKFITQHPVQGFQSPPSHAVESKIAYVLTMIQLVCALTVAP